LIEPPELAYCRLVGVGEFKCTGRSAYCILGRPPTVVADAAVLTVGAVVFKSAECGDIDAQFLDVPRLALRADVVP
jgi:hypothetical protein